MINSGNKTRVEIDNLKEQRYLIKKQVKKMGLDITLMDLERRNLDYYGASFPRSLIQGVEYLRRNGVDFINELNAGQPPFTSFGINPKAWFPVKEGDKSFLKSRYDPLVLGLMSMYR